MSELNRPGGGFWGELGHLQLRDYLRPTWQNKRFGILWMKKRDLGIIFNCFWSYIRGGVLLMGRIKNYLVVDFPSLPLPGPASFLFFSSHLVDRLPYRTRTRYRENFKHVPLPARAVILTASNRFVFYGCTVHTVRSTAYGVNSPPPSPPSPMSRRQRHFFIPLLRLTQLLFA